MTKPTVTVMRDEDGQIVAIGSDSFRLELDENQDWRLTVGERVFLLQPDDPFICVTATEEPARGLKA